MTEKKQAADWYIAATHWITSGFVMPLIVSFVAAFLLIILLGENSPLLVLSGLVILPLSLWLGACYSARYINRKYVIRNRHKVVKLATIYLVIATAVTNLLLYVAFEANLANIVNILALVLGAVVFYKTSQKRIGVTATNVQ